MSSTIFLGPQAVRDSVGCILKMTLPTRIRTNLVWVQYSNHPVGGTLAFAKSSSQMAPAPQHGSQGYALVCATWQRRIRCVPYSTPKTPPLADTWHSPLQLCTPSPHRDSQPIAELCISLPRAFTSVLSINAASLHCMSSHSFFKTFVVS